MQTNILLAIPLHNFSFYSFVFGATLTQYNLHYLMKTIAIKDSPRLAWSQRNMPIHLILLVTGIILILISLFSFRLHHFLILFCLGGISFLYSFPFLPFRKRRRIKDYGFLKIVTLAFLWTVVTVWFPVANGHYDTGLFTFIFIKRFVFMFVLCLLFDIRDIEIDGEEKIKTLSVILGKRKSYLLSYFLLFIFVIICVTQFIYLPQWYFLAPMIISAVATLITIVLTKKNNSDYIYLAGIDGMMLLQAILVMVFSLNL